MRAALLISRDALTTGALLWSPLRGDGGSRAAAIACDAAEVPPGDYDVVLASDLVLLETVSVPLAQRRKLGRGLRYLVEDRLACDPERVHVAVDSAGASDRVSIAVVDRGLLEQVLRRLGRAGVRPRAVYPELLTPALPPRGWTVICGAGGGFVRTGALEGFALEGPCGDAPPVALQLALRSARRSGAVPVELVVSAAEDVTVPEVRNWAAALGVPVRNGPTWRWFESAAPGRLDLLQGEFADTDGAGGIARRLRRPLALGAAVVVAVSSTLAIEWAMLASERRAIDGQMLEIYRAAVGPSVPAVDPPRQLARELADLRRRAGEPAPGDFLPLLEAVAEHLAEARAVQAERISYDAGSLTVTLHAPDTERAGDLRRQLGAQPVPGVELRPDESAGPGVRFTARAVP